MTSRIKVHHPAGVIDLGHGLAVDVELRRDALGSLIHARVPVMAEVVVVDGRDVGKERRQVGTAVLVTYATLPDGSAVDLEFDVELDADKPAEPAPEPKTAGWREEWRCDAPADRSQYQVIREEWNADHSIRTILEIRLL